MADIFNMLDTWNAAGTTFTGIKLNVTDTASAAGSLLMDLQVGGSSLFRVAKNGDMNARKLISSFWVEVGSSVLLRTEGLQVGSATEISFSSLSNPQSGSPDVRLFRDAANTLAQRNGVNAQAFNLYNTYTDASNYERGVVKWSSSILQIGSEKLGTGTARNVQIVRDGVVHLSAESGRLFFTTLPTVSSGQQLQFSNGSDFSRGISTNTVGGLAITNGTTGGQSLEFREMTAPAAPSANNVVVYAEDDGAGKTRLMARFATGAAVQIAIEP